MDTPTAATINWEPICVLISTIYCAWLHYNQRRHDKMTDLKIAEYKQELARKSARRSDNSAKIWGDIHHLLGRLNADRVYIIQTYPLGRNDFVTVQFEVTAKAVSPLRDSIHDMHFKEIPKFCSLISSTDFIHIKSLNDLEGMRARALFANHGTRSMYIQRLKDNTYDWVGSLVCDYTTDHAPSEDEARRIMEITALNIQYILPEIQ